MKIIIRIATIEDAPFIGAAQREIAKEPGLFCSQPSELTDENVLKTIQTTFFFVAECEGELIGHAFLEPHKTNSLKHISELNMAIHKKWQNRGVGKQLLTHIIEWAKKSETLEKILLNVRASNASAISLYRTMGFKEEGRLKKYLKLKDRYIDDIIMSLDPFLQIPKAMIRPMVQEDMDQIINTFCFPWNSPEATAEKWKLYFLEQQQNIRTIYLIEENRKFLGYASLLRVSQYPDFKVSGIPEIHDVWILENHRKRGLGEMLVRHLEIISIKEGYSTIGLGVGLYQDYGAAQRLYFKLGYMPDGKGITYHGTAVMPGESYPVDDDLNLWFKKNLI